ncbi:MAG: HAD family hydrolase [Actinomycetota bacterium]
MGGSLEVVFFDIGGVLYSDAVYRRALFLGLNDLGADVSQEDFDRVYEDLRSGQSASFRRSIAAAFLGPDPDVDAFQRATAVHWAYPPEALEPDVLPCLESVHGRYRLGIVANQPSHVRSAMQRDGIDRFFDLWGVSEDLGIEKPDPRIFAIALEEAGVPADGTAMVGDRLDYDVRPAKDVGIHTVWLLRGEAPANPTAEQLGVPEAHIASLRELPGVLGSM